MRVLSPLDGKLPSGIPWEYDLRRQTNTEFEQNQASKWVQNHLTPSESEHDCCHPFEVTGFEITFGGISEMIVGIR